MPCSQAGGRRGTGSHRGDGCELAGNVRGQRADRDDVHLLSGQSVGTAAYRIEDALDDPTFVIHSIAVDLVRQPPAWQPGPVVRRACLTIKVGACAFFEYEKNPVVLSVRCIVHGCV